MYIFTGGDLSFRNGPLSSLHSFNAHLGTRPPPFTLLLYIWVLGWGHPKLNSPCRVPSSTKLIRLPRGSSLSGCFLFRIRSFCIHLISSTFHILVIKLWLLLIVPVLLRILQFAHLDPPVRLYFYWSIYWGSRGSCCVRSYFGISSFFWRCSPPSPGVPHAGRPQCSPLWTLSSLLKVFSTFAACSPYRPSSVFPTWTLLSLRKVFSTFAGCSPHRPSSVFPTWTFPPHWCLPPWGSPLPRWSVLHFECLCVSHSDFPLPSPPLLFLSFVDVFPTFLLFLFSSFFVTLSYPQCKV